MQLVETASILIPCYNDEEYVGGAIESALNQTWSDCEIIVVDDGSSDGSYTVARRYESEDVQVLTQQNQGAATARNRALQMASGKYVQYLDADDLLHPRKIEAQITALKGRSFGTIAVCPTVYFQDGMPLEEGKKLKGSDQNPWLNTQDPIQWMVNLHDPEESWGMVACHAWLVPHEIVRRAGPWREDISLDDDGEFFNRVLLESNGVQCVDGVYAYYRQHESEGRVSEQTSEKALEGWLRSIDAKSERLLFRTTGRQYNTAAHGFARQYWSLALAAYPENKKVAARAESRAADLGFPEALSPISRNGWKGCVAKVVTSILGWRTARWLQWVYHRFRQAMHHLLSL
jgi:glycosyltransferase involved in cell wall biosynthesis